MYPCKFGKCRVKTSTVYELIKHYQGAHEDIYDPVTDVLPLLDAEIKARGTTPVGKQSHPFEFALLISFVLTAIPGALTTWALWNTINHTAALTIGMLAFLVGYMIVVLMLIVRMLPERGA